MFSTQAGGLDEATAWVRERLPAAEAWADEQRDRDGRHLLGPKWTSAVRGRLWAMWRARWRDERVILEEAQRRTASRRARVGATHDLGAALRKVFGPPPRDPGDDGDFGGEF